MKCHLCRRPSDTGAQSNSYAMALVAPLAVVNAVDHRLRTGNAFLLTSSPAGLALPPSAGTPRNAPRRSEEHTSELQSLMRISYAVFCLKKKKIFKYKFPQHASALLHYI